MSHQCITPCRISAFASSKASATRFEKFGTSSSSYAGTVGDSFVPVNGSGEKLHLFKLDKEYFAENAENGVLTLVSSNNTPYSYSVSQADPDGYRYVWAPAGSFDTSLEVPTAY